MSKPKTKCKNSCKAHRQAIGSKQCAASSSSKQSTRGKKSGTTRKIVAEQFPLPGPIGALATSSLIGISVSTHPEKKSRGGKRPGAGRKPIAPSIVKRARTIYLNDSDWNLFTEASESLSVSPGALASALLHYLERDETEDARIKGLLF